MRRDRADDAGRLVQAGACEDAGCPGTAHADDQPQTAAAQTAGPGVRIARHAAQFRFESRIVSGGRYEARVRELVTDFPRLAATVGPLLNVRRVMRQQLRPAQDAARRGPRRVGVRLLMTAPGVGAVVALTYRATVDQAQRFVHSRTFGAHVA